MNRIMLIGLLFFFTSLIPSFGQGNNKSGPFKKHEIELFNLLFKDSISPLSIKLLVDVFPLGMNQFYDVTKVRYPYISLLKNKHKIYLQPIGSGALYEVVKKSNQYNIIRLDETYHTGSNFSSVNYFFNDTLFKFGGSGWWEIKGMTTYFSNQTKEWEILKTNKPVYGYEMSNDIVYYFLDIPNAKFYASHSYEYDQFPKKLEYKKIDSAYELDHHSNTWTTKGKTNPNFNAIIENSYIFSSYLNFNHIGFINSGFTYYWIDYSKNAFGPINENKNNSIKDIWLKQYPTKENFYKLQFNLSDSVYLIKVIQDKLTYSSFQLSEKDINRSKAQEIYTPKESFTNNILQFLKTNRDLLLLGFIAVLVVLFILFLKKNKKVVSKELVGILFDNFYKSLSIVEKELLEALYKYQSKEEIISIKEINKIIGVQNKDILTQNKTRSDSFLKINQKFKLATQENKILISKQRNITDKRQFNYSIEQDYFIQIGQLLLA